MFSRAFIILIAGVILTLGGCKKDSTQYTGLPHEVIVRTDRTYYTMDDTLTVYLKNFTSREVVIGLTCGVYLGMDYQILKDGVWGPPLPFWYAYLRCATLLKPIIPMSTFRYSQPVSYFDSTGTIRLLVHLSLSHPDSNFVAISNSFTVH